MHEASWMDRWERCPRVPGAVYRPYINSEPWHCRRMLARERVGNKCQFCGSTDRLETHHLSYERLGEEAPEDLIILCRSCHTRFHEIWVPAKQHTIPVPSTFVPALGTNQAKTSITRPEEGQVAPQPWYAKKIFWLPAIAFFLFMIFRGMFALEDQSNTRTPEAERTATAVARDSSRTPSPKPGCDPAYPSVCIPPPPPFVDCGITTERNFPVKQPDPQNLDHDDNGIGCEPIAP